MGYSGRVGVRSLLFRWLNIVMKMRWRPRVFGLAIVFIGHMCSERATCETSDEHKTTTTAVANGGRVCYDTTTQPPRRRRPRRYISTHVCPLVSRQPAAKSRRDSGDGDDDDGDFDDDRSGCLSTAFS